MAFRIQIRRDTAEKWVINNPILLEGELGYETDTAYMKIGDGTTYWNDLPYWNPFGISNASVYQDGLVKLTGVTGFNFTGTGVTGITGSDGFATITVTGGATGGGSAINTFFSGAEIGTGITGLNFSGPGVSSVTDSNGYSTIIITGATGATGAIGATGATGAIGATGATGVGTSTLYNPISRYQAYINSDIELYIVSSATVNTGLSWTRSTTTLTITHTNHGRTNGDLVIVRNANADNFSGIVTVINFNSFSLTTANSGALSGSNAAYSLGFTASTATESALTIAAPSGGDCQLLSLLYATGSRTGATLAVTVPSSATNGAGANTTSQNQFYPISRVQTISTGAIKGHSMTLNTSSNFNVFNFAALDISSSDLIRLDF